MHRAPSCIVVSQRNLAGIVISCVVLAAWFILSKEELVERLDHDGQTQRLKQLADEQMAQQAPVVTAPQTDREKFDAWLDSADPGVFGDPAIQADRKNLCAATSTPLELGEDLIAHSDRVDAELFDALADALVKRALGLNRPADAARLLAGWFGVHPSWKITSRLIQAWQWSARPDDALKVLDAALASGLDPAGKPEDVEDLRVALALESDQPNVAFDIVVRSYDSANEEERPAILRRLVDLANAGDRTTEASRLIAEHFKTMPFQNVPLEQALTMLREGKAFHDEDAQRDYLEYAAAMARWQEWAGHGDLAFDTWLRLSLLGDDEAWARVIDLQDELLRSDDYALVLADRIQHGSDLDKEPALAAILLDNGRVNEAVAHLENAAKHLANPLPVFKQLAYIHQQSGEWEKSLAEFEKSLASDAKDVESQKGRAFSLVRLRRLEDGCQAWMALARQAVDDADTQETCAALCESLGHEHEAAEATRRLLACPGRASTPDEHLELATKLHQLGDDEGQIAVLRDALKRFPASAQTRLTLAESLAGRDEHDEAVQLLTDSSLRDNPAAIELLITEAGEGAEIPGHAEILGGTPPACLDHLPELQLKLAFLLEKLGRNQDGERIVAHLQKDGRFRETTVWHDLARASLDAGDAARAESFEALRLTSGGSRDSDAWELLGDIYAFQDRDADAAAAYKKAVQVLLPSGSRAEKPQPQITQARGF